MPAPAHPQTAPPNAAPPPTAPLAPPPAAVMPARPASLRLNDYYEVYPPADPDAARREGGACMNCGAAFCMPDSGYGPALSDHPAAGSALGCPIENKIPEWNQLVHLGRWRDAYDRLSLTNPFPEFTSRVCPAPCQDACIVGINADPIQIKGIERAIIDRAFASGWVAPPHAQQSTGRHVAIVGSGPAGLAAADRLTRLGHRVTVYERSDTPGGLLMYGVPNMKLDKAAVDRRVALLAAGGVRFRVDHDLGQNVDPDQIVADHDATLLAVGALQARDLDLPGRHLAGVESAMDVLTASTRHLRRPQHGPGRFDAAGKRVVVIGGGDTGADCLGTALRQGCRSLINLTRRPQPPPTRDARHPWPGPPGTYLLDYAHAEGLHRHGRDPREYEIEPLAFLPDPTGQRVASVRVRRLDTHTVADLPADLVVLAIGFTGHDCPPLIQSLGLDESRGRLAADAYATSRPGVYAAGDCRRGPSLVVWAIREGRRAADRIHTDLLAAGR